MAVSDTVTALLLLNDNLYKHEKLIYGLIDLLAVIYSFYKYE